MRQEDIGSFNDSFERYRDRITNFSNEFEFGLFLHIAKISLPFIFLIIFLFGLGGFLYLRYTIPQYRADTVLQLAKSDQAQEILQVGSYFDGNVLSSDLELLRSGFMLSRTLEKLNLPVRYFEQGRIRSSEHYKKSGYEVKVISMSDTAAATDVRFLIDFMESGKFMINFRNEEYGPFRSASEIDLGVVKFVVLVNNTRIYDELALGNQKYFLITSKAPLAKEFSKQISARVVNPTAQTISISCENPNPLLARDIVMTHAMAFLDYDRSRKEKSSERILLFIDNQLDTVSENLRNAEFLLNSFKQEYSLSNVDNISNVYIDRLNQVEQKIFELGLEDRMLDEIAKVESEDLKEMDVYNLMAVVIGTDYEQSLQHLLDELENLLKSKEELFFDITENSEYAKSLDYRIEIQKKLIVESISSLKDKNKTKRGVLEERRLELESVFKGLPSKELEYARYARLYDINEKYYTNLLEKKIEYRISKAGFVNHNTILEPAMEPKSQISPVKNVTYAGFLGAGFLISLIFVIARYLLHNNITSLNEIAKLSEASIGVLGIIPKFKENIPVSQLVIHEKPKSVLAESFRSIRTNLQFVDNDPGSKVIAVTSTISSEGKTFIAINLAGIIAISGKKVILLDLDMRKPKIHRGFDVENDRGMSTLLINKDTLEDCIRQSDIPNLQYITAGPIPPNPSELVISSRMNDLLEEIKAEYDIVVIDNPPVGLVTDGISTIRMADYPLYIFRADYSKKHFVQNVDRLINENGIQKLSVILNGVDIERNKYGSYYGYGYGYGYAYGGGYGYYGSDDKKKSFWERLKTFTWK